jgi:hypothetical protein
MIRETYTDYQRYCDTMLSEMIGLTNESMDGFSCVNIARMGGKKMADGKGELKRGVDVVRH